MFNSLFMLIFSAVFFRNEPRDLPYLGSRRSSQWLVFIFLHISFYFDVSISQLRVNDLVKKEQLIVCVEWNCFTLNANSTRCCKHSFVASCIIIKKYHFTNNVFIILMHSLSLTQRHVGAFTLWNLIYRCEREKVVKELEQ